MTILKNLPAGVASGTVPTSGAGGNTGGQCGDYFDAYNVTGGANTMTFDNGQMFRGLVSYKVTGIGVSGAAYLMYSTRFSGLTFSTEISFYLTALPASEMTLIWLGNGTTTTATVGLLTTGKLVQRALGVAGTPAGGTGTANSGTVVAPLNQWNRVELAGTISSTVGVMRSALFAGESTTALDSLYTTTNNTGSLPITNARIGLVSTTTTSQAWWVSGFLVNDASSALPGPFPTPMPTLSGTVVGSDSFTGADGVAPDSSKWTPTLGTGATALLGSNQLVLTPGTGTYSTATSGLYMSGAPGVDNVSGSWDIMCIVGPKNPISPQYIAIGMSTSGTLRSGDVLTGNGYGFSITPNAGTFSVSRTISGSKVNLSGDIAFSITAGLPLVMRFQHLNTGVISVWIWGLGQPVPTSPSWTGTDTSPVAGIHRPILSVSNGSSATPTPSTYDDFSYATTARTQGWFIWDGTKQVPATMFVKVNATDWVAAPASEVA